MGYGWGYGSYKKLQTFVTVKYRPVVDLRVKLHFLHFYSIYTPPRCAHAHARTRTRIEVIWNESVETVTEHL
jgi:hypothetical protein